MSKLTIQHKLALFIKKEHSNYLEDYPDFDDFIGEVRYEAIEFCCSHCVIDSVNEAEAILKEK